MKNISILGSTGSIGTQTLDIVRDNDDINVCALAAGSNIDLLEKQIREFKPKVVSVWDSDKAEELKKRVRDTDVDIYTGMNGLITAATVDSADIVVLAVVGMVGIRPAIAAINAHKDIALANKETLVTAGHIIMTLAKEKNVRILPVDSEHSAIFQCLNGEDTKEVSKLILTASGGPFRGMTREQMKNVKVEDALKHPNWSMGRKITIDSATMVNKGLEIIEAKWLFDMAVEDIQVVVQPQSLIHSMVEFEDGAIMAQLGTPDMRLPIQYALYYPERRYLKGERVDFSKIASINFEIPDMDNFRGLYLARQAGITGGSMPTVMNAANEKAVALFLDKKIGFLDIIDIMEKSMNRHVNIKNPSLDDILQTEQDTYDYIDGLLGERKV
ncbi:1-deoxy-D-xylulose-5-phosphate reductoisomerase [Lachnospiraceae bacterium HCP1S3_C3]|nr:1-deoxy-D-xylulose-5-phosphate reductoisomerase [Lachnospiraceae bacterium]MDD6858337.1 1-deoxy-D-xylulose-5-phosphate reductoisomerase [Lachnospiraceae bacterium]